MQVDAYIRQVMGLPPREQQQQPPAAAVAAPADTADPSEGNGRRNRGTVQAEQVGVLDLASTCMPSGSCHCFACRLTRAAVTVRFRRFTAVAVCF
jgi:hypothetical protein